MKNNAQVAVVSLDRYIRLFQLEGERRLLSKIYIKQRATAMAIDEDYVDPSEAENDDESGKKRSRGEEDQDVEDLLDGLEAVE
ncbi:hypothetical protein HDU67_003769 [Dinochytrium kinnereticum]|nr:hypothetical protein HDU67_003769 [Dinochytrium kinnereticum]